MPNPRATRVERDRRVFAVQNWIISGVQDAVILKEAQSEWNINLRMARRYLRKARDAWKSDQEATIEDLRSDKIARLQELARSLKSEYKGTPEGIKSILAVEKEIIKLQNITPPKVHVLEGNRDKPLLTMQPVTLVIQEYNG